MAHRTEVVSHAPKIRQTAYYAGSLLLAVLGIVQIWTGIDAEQITEIGDYITGILTVLGAAAPAYAAKKVGTQVKDGSVIY